MDKTILITGAASGIGFLVAENLLKQQFTIIAVDVNKQGLANMQTQLAQHAERIFPYVCDLSQKSQIDKTVKQILAKHKKVDVLVNNAGIVSGKIFLDLSESDIQKTMDINVMAGFWLTKAFLPSMVANDDGQIVFISSAAGIVGVNKLSDYCASKFAVFGLAESLRVEMKRMKANVTISIVSPYYIKTGMFQGVQTRFSFLLPLLEPQKVADKISRLIIKRKSLLVMPTTVRLLWLMRYLGVKLFDASANLLGVNQTMQHFVGRQEKEKNNSSSSTKTAASEKQEPVKTESAKTRTASRTKNTRRSTQKSSSKESSSAAIKTSASSKQKNNNETSEEKRLVAPTIVRKKRSKRKSDELKKN